jgi:hypothetical protein
MSSAVPSLVPSLTQSTAGTEFSRERVHDEMELHPPLPSEMISLDWHSEQGKIPTFVSIINYGCHEVR